MAKIVPLRQTCDSEATPAWVALVQPRTAAKAAEVRRYIEYLRSVYRIERRDDLAPPYRATTRPVTTDECIYRNAGGMGLLIYNEGVMQ